MSLPENLLIVEVKVDPTVEEQWNRWYNDEHLPEIVACPGFRSGQRYVADEGAGRRYVTIYELDTPAALTSAEFAARRGWGPFVDKVEFKTRRYSRVAQTVGA